MDEKDRNNLHSDLSLLITDERILKNKFYFFEHVNLGKTGTAFTSDISTFPVVNHVSFIVFLDCFANARNNELWHFRQFANKPDSTNNFIK
jgi:hypothetical protein